MTRPTIVAVALAAIIPHARIVAASRTVTGLVTDTMCGATHRLSDTKACLRECISHGSDYALVVNGTVYTLTANATEQAELRKLAGKVAVVRGDVNDNAVRVESVSKAKKIRKH